MLVLVCVLIRVFFGCRYQLFEFSCKDTAILPKYKVFALNSLLPIRLSQCFVSLHEVACDELAEQRCSQASECVGEEVEPVARAGRREHLLSDLDSAAEEDGCDDAPHDELHGLGLRVAHEIFEPQHAAEPEVHQEVQHLVDVVDVVERRLGRVEEGEKQYDSDEGDRERIFLQVVHEVCS